MAAFLRFLIITTVCCTLASSLRVLVLPYPWMSVVNEVTAIADELVNRKHEVYVVLADNYPMDKFPQTQNQLKFITYTQKYPDLVSSIGADPEEFYNALLKDKSPILDIREGYDVFLGGCKNILEDTDLEEKVKKLNFDMVVVSAVLPARCLYVVPYRLGLPYVSITTDMEPWLNRNPSLPSFVPVQMQDPPLTANMTFWERVMNTKRTISWVFYADQVPMASDDLVIKYAPDKPAVSINYLAGQSLLWLLDIDIVIDYPRPMMPNEINIGGLTTRPAKPLPTDLEKFMSSAKEGVIVASFGSVPLIPRAHMLRILEGLKMVSSDFHIILRWHLPQVPDIPSNVLLMKYIPQIDILGHPKTRLFMTHAGANSQFEALYHAVPMLHFPVVWDQHYDAKRADVRGFSKTIDINNYSSNDIADAVAEILGNPSFKRNILHASSIFRAQPMSPRVRAAFWIDHVLQYGGQHLRAHALDMPAYQYLMLDVISFILISLFVCFLAMYLFFVLSKKALGFC